MSRIKTKRLFADVYDSVRQGVHCSLDSREAQERYLGRLRLDALLTGRVVLTDAQLLDGTFFLGAGSTGPGSDSKFGIDPTDIPLDRIEIRSRADTLEEAIVGIVKRKGSDKLVGVYFSSLPAELRDPIRDELAQRPAYEISNWHDVPNLLKAIGVPDEYVDRLRAGWRYWIDKQKEFVAVRNWNKINESPASFSFQLVMREYLEREMRGLNSCLGDSDEVKSWIAEVIRLYRLRSDVYSYLEGQLEEHQAHPDSVSALNTIRTWYNSAYNKTIAKQHGCDTVETTDIFGSWAVSAAQREYDQVANQLMTIGPGGAQTLGRGPLKVIEIEGGFLEALCRMNAEVYGSLFARHSGYLEQWYTTSKSKSLHDAVNYLMKAVEESGHWHRPESPQDDLSWGLRLLWDDVAAKNRIPIGLIVKSFLQWLRMDPSRAGRATRQIMEYGMSIKSMKEEGADEG